MPPFSFRADDAIHHTVTFGIDVYPPIEIREERTHLNMFYEEASSRWRDLYERLIVSDTEFRISKAFRKDPEVQGPSLTAVTFVLTQRGPVLTFPLLLPEPIGRTGLEEAYLERFDEIRRFFFSALPTRKVMRLGMVRDLMFPMDQAACQSLLTPQASFGNADLLGGNCLLHYCDRKYNLRVQFEPGQLSTQMQLPVGATVTQHTVSCLHVRLDVNNRETRPLEDADIEEVLARATGLWPDVLLDYLNERSVP